VEGQPHGGVPEPVRHRRRDRLAPRLGRRRSAPGAAPEHVPHAGAGTELTFAGKSLAEWQAEGQDEGSVIGDPGFSDPARDDFSLRPDAPAISAVGFQPFDQEIRKAGLYGDPEWCSIGSRYARRQPSATWTPEDLARLVAFDMDFEDMPVGYQPEIFRLSTSGEGTFQVSDDAAYTGTKSARAPTRRAWPRVSIR
jgi:hypothetical protein